MRKVKYAIVHRKDVNFGNRIDAEYFQNKLSIKQKFKKDKDYYVFGQVCKESFLKIDPTTTPFKQFKYLEITDVNLKDGSYFSQEILGEEAPSRARKKCVFKNIIISTVRPNRNAVAIILDHEDLVCSTGFCVYNPISKLTAEEIFIFLKSRYAISQLSRRVRATMYPAVSHLDIEELIIPKFELKLKRRIKDNFQLLKKIRANILSLSINLDKIVNKFCREVFAGIDINNFNKKNNTRILTKSKIFGEYNRIDSEFYLSIYEKLQAKLLEYGKFKVLDSLYDFISTGKTPSKGDYREPEESQNSIIKVGSLTNYGINWSGVEYISEDFFKKHSKYSVKKSDILFTSSAHSSDHIGKKIDVVEIIPEEMQGKCLFVGELMLLRNTMKNEISPHFIASYLRSEYGKMLLQRCIRGISSHIYDSDIKNYVFIPIPPLKLEKKIAGLARKIEEKKDLYVATIRKLVEEYEDSIEIEI